MEKGKEIMMCKKSKRQTDEKSSKERLEVCIQELIDIAKQLEIPSKVIKKTGENLLYVAAVLEIIERGER